MGILSKNTSYFENMIIIQACVAMTTGITEIGCLRQMKYKLHLLHELI